MSKLTVAQFLNADFEFVAGDYLDGKYPITKHTFFYWNNTGGKFSNWFVESLTPRQNTGTQPVADDCVVEVTGNNGNIYVAQAINVPWFKTVDKSQNGAVYAVVSWKPSLKHLEQQMNDKQESAMNISERDIENEFIKQEDAEVEREFSESCEVIWGNGETAYVEHSTHDEIIFIGLANNKAIAVCECITNGRSVILDKFWVSDLLKVKPLTPEQLAAKERDDSVDTMLIDAGFRGNVNVNEFRLNNLDSDLNVVFDSMFNLYDAGYRK